MCVEVGEMFASKRHRKKRGIKNNHLRERTATAVIPHPLLPPPLLPSAASFKILRVIQNRHLVLDPNYQLVVINQ